MKKTIIDLFESSVEKFGEKPFLLEKTTDKFEPTTYAESREIALKTGAGLVKGLVMGSTAQNVVLNSTCGILLLPAEDALDD